jgi:DegV family protein with EDD domain
LGVRVVTDTSACLPAEVASRPDVRVLPITIHLPWGDVRGDAPGAARVVFDCLERGGEVKSSAPSVVDYLAAIEEAGPAGALVIVPASEFTVMHRNADLAAALARSPARVVDSRTAAAAQGLVVLAALEAIDAGADLAEAARAAEDAARRARLVAALDDLSHLRRSGRVPAPALSFAERLGIKPVFRLRDGAVERIGVPRSEEAALRRIAREASLGGIGSARRSTAFHAACPERAARLLALLRRTDHVVEFSPAMGIHTGPGVVGVAWLAPEP